MAWGRKMLRIEDPYFPVIKYQGEASLKMVLIDLLSPLDSLKSFDLQEDAED